MLSPTGFTHQIRQPLVAFSNNRTLRALGPEFDLVPDATEHKACHLFVLRFAVPTRNAELGASCERSRSIPVTVELLPSPLGGLRHLTAAAEIANSVGGSSDEHGHPFKLSTQSTPI